MTVRAWLSGREVVIRSSGPGEVRIPISECPDLIARMTKLVLAGRVEFEDDFTPVETRAGKLGRDQR